MELGASKLERGERKASGGEAFRGSSSPPGPTPEFTGGEFVWILGSKWQILNSQLLKRRRNVLEGWGIRLNETMRETRLYVGSGTPGTRTLYPRQLQVLPQPPPSLQPTVSAPDKHSN